MDATSIDLMNESGQSFGHLAKLNVRVDMVENIEKTL